MATNDGPRNVPNIPLALAHHTASGGGGGGGGDPVAGFTAETDFALADNGDGTLSITDTQSRFGTKPNAAKPVYYIPFGEGYDQPHPALSRLTTSILWAPQCSLTTSFSKTGSTHSMTIDTAMADGSNSIFQSQGGRSADATLVLPENPGGKYYRYYDVYNDFTAFELRDALLAATGGADQFPNFKTHRWQSASANPNPYAINTLQAYNYYIGFLGDNIDTGKLYGNTREAAQLGARQWHTEEEYHRISSAAGALDAFCTGVVDGVEKFTLSNFDTHKGLDPTDPQYRWEHYKVGNFRLWAATGECPWRANLLYVDDSLCRVHITDKPTWSAVEAKAMEIQVPVGWAAGQVDFHHRLGAMGSLTGKYLWVTDNNDTKILVGGWS